MYQLANELILNRNYSICYDIANFPMKLISIDNTNATFDYMGNKRLYNLQCLQREIELNNVWIQKGN